MTQKKVTAGSSAEDYNVGKTAVDLAVLLKTNKLGQFVQAMSEEGYDYVEVSALV